MDIKPIPAFYCCYLLRSAVRHASLYVGSTPNPARRLAQHNGKVKGGAVRTSRLSLRPWEMTCIVAGFPSNIAALQFEWAWQNAHLTRHIPPDARISFATTRTKTSSRTGKVAHRPGRPRTSLMDKLSNLHLLLRVPYFAKWPLEVRFFSEDVFRTWQTWCERVDSQIRPEVKVVLDLPRVQNDPEEITSAQAPPKRQKIELIGQGGVEGVDPTYARLQDVLEKSRFILDEDDEQKCNVCDEQLDVERDLFTICPHDSCSSLSHIECLSKKFLKDSATMDLIPSGGHCPSCHNQVDWPDLMQEVSLRARGMKEIRKLLSKKKRTKAATAVEIMESEAEEEENEDSDDELGAEAISDEEGDLDDGVSVTSMDSYTTTISTTDLGPKQRAITKALPIVIEDSDEESPVKGS